MPTTIDGVDAFGDFVGKELGHSEWLTISQERVNLFADATDDHQWIHVDPERAKDGPFGVAIAHGYLTLSLAPVAPQPGDPRREHEVRRELRLRQGPLPLARPGRLRPAHGGHGGRRRRRRGRRAGHLRPGDARSATRRSRRASPRWSTATTADDAGLPHLQGARSPAHHPGPTTATDASVLPAQEEKTARVRAMFDLIAPRYDLVNRLMTLGLDQRWRRTTVTALALPAGARVLDLACGTGDLSRPRPATRDYRSSAPT